MILSIAWAMGMALAQYSRMAGDASITKLCVVTATGSRAPITQSKRMDQPFSFSMAW